MTGQDILDRMELLNQELQLQSGETDVTRGLLALNVAQDYFEARAALRPGFMGGSTGTVTTTASTETTSFPSSLLRIDRLQYLDPDTSRPAWKVEPIKSTGDHAAGGFWPAALVSTSVSGKPRGYWTDGTNFYWSPLPDATHTVRYYGLVAAAAITASGTFAYKDIVALPLASFAVKILRTGVDDNLADIDKLAAQAFDPVLDALGNFNRDGAEPFVYKYGHDT